MTAFSQFYEENYALALSVAGRRLSCLEDAEDVVSEAFRISLERHRRGDPVTVPWLYGVIRNLVGSEYRRRTRRAGLHEKLALAWTESETEPPSSPYGVWEALTMLSEAQREAIVIIYWDGLTMAEAAAVMAVTLGAMKIRVMRARRSFSRALDAVRSRGGDAACTTMR